MASYDRNFLVPYLRDLCCTEMLIIKLEQDISFNKKEADKFTGWANKNYDDPSPPDPKDYEVEAEKGSIITSLVCVLLGICLISAIFISILLFVAAYFFYREQEKEDEMARKKSNDSYERALKSYKQKVQQNKEWRQQRPEWRKLAEHYRDNEDRAQEDLRHAKQLRYKLYSLNIIAKQYRKRNEVYYLYNFAAGSRETDLDKIIGIMLVDKIVQHLDEIIALKQEELLLMRRQIALQESQNLAIADNHREKMRRIAQMERNQERQMDYQRMIEVNQEVTNFFLAADYIERHR